MDDEWKWTRAALAENETYHFISKKRALVSTPQYSTKSWLWHWLRHEEGPNEEYLLYYYTIRPSFIYRFQFNSIFLITTLGDVF